MERINRLIIFSILLLAGNFSHAQRIKFEFDKIPENSGFKMEGYWVWCGSMIKVDSIYHLFAARWPKTSQFPEGYRDHSEIVRATSKSPLGPFVYEEVIIGERDSACWDANMAHNPTIHRIGDTFVLFYIGSDFTTFQHDAKSLLRRIGYATSNSINGPWKRCDRPVIETESNNPAFLYEKDKVKLMFRNAQLRVIMAEAPSYTGPYKIVNENVWPECRLEDFYLFKAGKHYHMVCEDNTGGVSGHERWGVHLYSENGINDWKKYMPVIVYNHTIALDNDAYIECVRRERPQLFIQDNKITHIVTSVYDGENSWSQPVGLKNPIVTE